ncbi:hypothetical protein [Bifidobacterium breve]|uniref:hypothetical protein n=1 Tax=Bifidobacterium breve TaxID=1685 RepID=UPI001E41D6E9|nr:hypothetical protein [Bifidobacterium breve]
MTIFIAYAPGTLSLVCDLFDPYSGIFGALFKFVVLFITGTSLINVYARKDTLANTSEHNYYSYPRIPRHHEGTDRPRSITRRIQIHAGVFCQIFVGRFGVSFSPFERLFLGRFGFGQSCGLSVIA